MNSKKSNILFSYMFACASVLLAVAFITISNSYSLSSGKTSALDWEVAFSEAKTEGENGKTIISGDRIVINASLKSGDTYQVVTSLDNNGDIDAMIDGINNTDLTTMEVGTSKDSGKVYHLSDYISYRVEYLNDNKDNGIVANESFKVGDIINRNTKNDIVIMIKYKNYNELTEDQIKVLKDNIEAINGEYIINLDLSVGLRIVGKE